MHNACAQPAQGMRPIHKRERQIAPLELPSSVCVSGLSSNPHKQDINRACGNPSPMDPATGALTIAAFTVQLAGSIRKLYDPRPSL